MSLGDIIDGIFRLVRANAAVLLPLLMLADLPFQALIAYAERNGPTLGQMFSNLGSLQGQSGLTSGTNYLLTYAGILGSWLVAPVAAGVVCRAVFASYRGEQIRAGQLARMSPRLVLVLLLASVLGHLCELVGLVLCILPGVAVLALLFLTAPVIVAEGLGPVAGLRRSWRLVSHHFWRVLGIVLLGALLITISVDILSVVPNLLASLASPHVHAVAQAVIGTFTGALQWSLYATLASLLYFDQRIRQEGLDLEVMAARAR